MICPVSILTGTDAASSPAPSADAGFAAKPTSSPEARTWPAIAALSAAKLAPARASRAESSANTCA
ncbi:hypothetical protein ACFSLT_19190 [Novosphingobium resinovorum]